MESFRKEELGNTNELFESMYDHAKILYRLYNKIAKFDEQTREYNEGLENIKIVIYSENKLYKNKNDEILSRLLKHLSKDEKFFRKGKTFKDDGFYLIDQCTEHPSDYYALRRVFNRLKTEYLDRSFLAPDSIESLGIKSLIQEKIIIDGEKTYNIYNRKNECERLTMIADYANMLNYYDSLDEASKKDQSFIIYKNLLMLINPYLESQILFGKNQEIIHTKNIDLLYEYILPTINTKVVEEILDSLKLYDDELVKNKNEFMKMKLLILRIHSICVDFGFEAIRESIEILSLGNLAARINGSPRKKKLITEVRKYLI